MSCLNAYHDFGVVGNTYDIQEADIMELFKEKSQKIDKKELNNNIKKEIRKAMVGKIHLHHCFKDSLRKIDIFNHRVATTDIDIEEGDIHIKAGQSLSSFYHGEYLNYVVINAKSAHELLWLEEQKNNPLVIISEGDLLKLNSYPTKFLLNDILKNSFDLKCTPSRFEIKDGYLIIHEYNIDRKKRIEEEK